VKAEGDNFSISYTMWKLCVTILC